LPSQSTLNRRLRQAAFELFLNWLTEHFRGAGRPGLALSLDGKPLLVGGCSKDPDARSGRAAGHVGKGDKRPAVWGARPLPEAWAVVPWNEHEVPVAQRLVLRLGGAGYLLADGNYDANRLFDTAAAHGDPLVAEQRDHNPARATITRVPPGGAASPGSSPGSGLGSAGRCWRGGPGSSAPSAMPWPSAGAWAARCRRG
jgi:hypothetical protein